MKIQLPLFLSLDQLSNTPLIKKYEHLFSALDLKELPEFNTGIGADGTSQHALLRAFIVRSLESLSTVSALIRFLEANPALKILCGFEDGFLPHNSQFYRFLKKTNHSIIEKLLITTNKILIEKGVLKTDIVAIDSKPVKALTKHNNPKNIRRNITNKSKRPRRTPKATLGYYSSHQPSPGSKKSPVFFWGFRSHAIVDVESGLVLVQGTWSNNLTDAKIARKLLRKLKLFYKTEHGMIIIGDKNYDERDLYTFIVEQIKAEPVIPINPRNTQDGLEYSQSGNRICAASLEMTPVSVFADGNRLRKKFRCPLKASKKVAAEYPGGCPLNSPKFQRYGCCAYQDVTDDARSRVKRGSPRFKTIYAKRFVIEKTFSRVHELKIEEARHYGLTAIRNSNTIDYLSLALVALASVRMKKPQNINRFRTFAVAA
jgi:hypothetical protein